ncbi:MAG: hypothetical protein ACRYFS_00540 [Janthinobacterium lividum]
MAVKLSNIPKPNQVLERFLPVLITSGPVFLWMGLQDGVNTALQSSGKRPDWLSFGIAIAGFFMLMLGLVALLLKQQRLEQRLTELERLKN